jgi:hypothetical protein
MAVNSNSAGGLLRRSTGMPTGAFTFAGFFRLATAVGGDAFQSVFALDNNVELSEFYWEPGNTRLRWHARSGGVDSIGDVFNTLVGNQAWFFLASRWQGGGADVVQFAWRRLNDTTLTTVSSTRIGFASQTLRIFEGFLFSQAFGWDAAGIKVWGNYLSNAELFQESFQMQPRRYADLTTAYPLTRASSVTESYNNLPFTLIGTVLNANNPDIPSNIAAAG